MSIIVSLILLLITAILSGILIVAMFWGAGDDEDFI